MKIPEKQKLYCGISVHKTEFLKIHKQPFISNPTSFFNMFCHFYSNVINKSKEVSHSESLGACFLRFTERTRTLIQLNLYVTQLGKRVFIAYANSGGTGQTAQPRSLTEALPVRQYIL